jgi:hypothetical protein
MSKRFVNVFTNDIIEWIDFQIIDAGISDLCLIINGLDHQA